MSGAPRELARCLRVAHAALVLACGKTTPRADDAAAPAPPSQTAEVNGAEGGSAAPVLNATPLPSASVASFVNPESLPAYSGPTGSVEGTITVTGAPAPKTPADFHRCPGAEDTWGVAFREGTETDGGARPLADAIVGVTGYTGFFVPERSEAKSIAIEGCAYASRTLTLTFGQRIEVKNRTKDFWSPVLEPTPSAVLMMAAPNGDPVRLYPEKPGHYVLTDRDRAYAVVDVYAFLHPLHTATDRRGRYRIDGVPVGKLKLSATHPRLANETQVDIDIAPGVVHRVDLTLRHEARDGGAAARGDGGPRPPDLR